MMQRVTSETSSYSNGVLLIWIQSIHRHHKNSSLDAELL